MLKKVLRIISILKIPRRILMFCQKLTLRQFFKSFKIFILGNFGGIFSAIYFTTVFVLFWKIKSTNFGLYLYTILDFQNWWQIDKIFFEVNFKRKTCRDKFLILLFPFKKTVFDEKCTFWVLICPFFTKLIKTILNSSRKQFLEKTLHQF